MKRQTAIVFITILSAAAILSALLTPVLVQAQTLEFNPNQILSDEELQDYQTLTQKEIEIFLKAKGSGLAGRILPDITDAAKLASQIIFDAAQTYRINPRYILTLIQKEQSLAEDPTPSQRQLDWATGYGVCDGCSMNDPAIQKYKGFAKQIDYGAGSARFYLDNPTHPSLKRVNSTVMIDATPVVPLNIATAYFYTYTPHLHGNLVLWNVWNRWFTKIYPNGTVMQANGDKDVWLIQNGLRRKFVNKAALVSRFDPKAIVTVSASDLLRFPEGAPIKFMNYSLLRAPNGVIFLLTDEVINPFVSEKVVRKFGYQPDEIIDVEEADIAGFEKGNFITSASIFPLGALLQDKKSKTIYWVKNGTRRVVGSPFIAKLTFPKSKIRVSSMKELSEYPLEINPVRLPEGMLVAVKNTKQVYVISDGKRRYIPSETIMKGLGYNAKNIKYVDEATLTMHNEGEPVYLNIDQLASAR
ncbi:MAG: hypothetical protein HW383_422 [Candidatus Magasanikbacteria bacterium]|nr:hypothetical protein [Candidatus Magasanikbacteria bacterium]